MQPSLKLTNSAYNLLEKADKWSNETIKTGLIAKFLKPTINLLSHLFQNTNKSIVNFFSMALFISLCILFISLFLPQFSSDRAGIGILIFISFLIFTINLILKNLTQIKFNFIDFLVILFLLIILISTFSSYFLIPSIKGLFKYLSFFAFYFITKVSLLNFSEKKISTLWLIMFLCTLFISAIGIYQYLIGVEPLASWEDPTQENTHTRVYSTLGNPNLLAGILILIFPLGITFFVKSKKNLSRIFYLIALITILLCTIFTGSRGGYIGLIVEIFLGIVVLFLYFLQKVKIKNKILITFLSLISLLCLIFIIVFLFPVIVERISTIFTFREHSSNNYRINVWLSCLEMFKQNWLLGIGPGNNTFFLAYGLYMKSGFDALAAYNVFLEIGLETGILGLLTFAFMLVVSFLKLHRLFWEKDELSSLGIFISLAGVISHGIFDTVFFRPQIFILFWFLIAYIAKLEVKEN